MAQRIQCDNPKAVDVYISIPDKFSLQQIVRTTYRLQCHSKIWNIMKLLINALLNVYCGQTLVDYGVYNLIITPFV